MSIFDPANYAFSYWALPNLVAGTLILSLGFFAFVRERFTAVALSFLSATFFIGSWQITQVGLNSSNNLATALLWGRLFNIVVYFMIVSFHFFVLSVCDQYQRYRFLVWMNLALALVFAWLTIYTTWLQKSCLRHFWGYYPDHGFVFPVFVLLFCATDMESLRLLWVGSRQTTQINQKRRLKALAVAFGICSMAVPDFIARFGVSFYPFGYIPSLIFVILCFRAIFKYRLVDVTPSFAVKQIIATMGEALVIVDREGVIRVTNPAGGPGALAAGPDQPDRQRHQIYGARRSGRAGDKGIGDRTPLVALPSMM